MKIVLKWLLITILVPICLILIIIFVNYSPYVSKGTALRIFKLRQTSWTAFSNKLLDETKLISMQKMPFWPFLNYYGFVYENNGMTEYVDFQVPTFGTSRYWKKKETQILVDKLCTETGISYGDFDEWRSFLRSYKILFFRKGQSEGDEYIEILISNATGFYYIPTDNIWPPDAESFIKIEAGWWFVTVD